MISQFREELQQLRTRERNVVAGRAGADQEVGDGCCQSETLILRHLVEIYERDLAHIANFDKRDHHRLFLLSSKSRRTVSLGGSTKLVREILRRLDRKSTRLNSSH